MNITPNYPKLRNATTRLAGRSEGGAALIIILAMLVLLLGILGAFLARSGTNRDTSASSASLTAVELLTSVAINNVVGNLQEEIRDENRSTSYDPPNGGDTLYLPKEPEYAVPELELPGLTITDILPDPNTRDSSGLENLLKVSVNPNAATPTDEPSRNRRVVTPERWNKPLLMLRAAADGSDDSPPANFPTPEWILVARDGSNTATLPEAKWDADLTNRKTVIGRYAYVVYNQGGLLDANIAGYPESADAPVDLDGDGTNDITDPARYKPSAAYADLTIPEIGLTDDEIQEWIEEWRNEATLSAPDPATEYFKLNLQNKSGFLSTGHQSAPGGATDRMFVGRRQLIDFFEDKLDAVDGQEDKAILDALLYFTTFSRSQGKPNFYQMQGAAENDSDGNPLPNYDNNAPAVRPFNIATARADDFDVPSDNNGKVSLGNSAYTNTASPPGPTDHVINPIFPAITMTGSGTRIDGSTFEAGEPLMKKRFPLDRLVWITYKGPSANLSSGDPLTTQLMAEGITQEFLDQGTAANIEKAFGLRWVGPNGSSNDYRIGGHWVYDVHGLTTGSNPINLLYDPDPPSTSPPPDVVSQDREPDFFEILKATVDVGAIGRAHRTFKAGRAGPNPGLGYFDEMRRQSFINHQIIQIGANIIDQVHPENFPTQIVIFDPDPEDSAGGRNRSFWGVVDLPYLYGWSMSSVMTHRPNQATVYPYNELFPKTVSDTPPGPYPDSYPEHGANRGDGFGDSKRYLDVDQYTGANVIMMNPILWNPHGEQSTFTNGMTAAQMRTRGLTPGEYRICVTTTNFPEMKASANTGSAYTPQRGAHLDELQAASGGVWRTRANLDGPHFDPNDEDVKPHLQTQWEDPTDILINTDEGIIDFQTTNKTAIEFDYTYDNSNGVFRQPTPILRDNVPGLNIEAPTDSQLRSIDMGDISSSINYGNGIVEAVTGERFFGFYMFRVPPNYARDIGDGMRLKRMYKVEVNPPASRTYTFSLEYRSPDTNGWIPYRQLTAPVENRNWGYIVDSNWDMAPDAATVQWGADYSYRYFTRIVGLAKRWQIWNHDDTHQNRRDNINGNQRAFIDPRTERWGAAFENWRPQLRDANGNLNEDGFITDTWRPGTGIASPLPVQPEHTSDENGNTDGLNDIIGGGVMSLSPFILDHDSYSTEAAPWGRNNFTLYSHYIPMADPDGIPRRTLGAWVPVDPGNPLLAQTTVGMPMATEGADFSNTNNNRFNRPILLRRPFRSVAELSYAFTDTPWRHVDFSTPESGYSGLLDVFCIGEDERTESVLAGKVDLNTRQMPVLKALLLGAYRDDRADTNQYEIDGPEAETIAQNLINWTNSSDSDKGPLWNLAHLVGRFDPDADLDTPVPSRVRFDGFSSVISTPSATDPGTIIPRLREAPIRILSQLGQAGTWNLMVDLVAQTGKYPPSANNLNDFVIEAEKRVWLHLAIDRATGDIIDYEVEVVTE